MEVDNVPLSMNNIFQSKEQLNRTHIEDTLLTTQINTHEVAKKKSNKGKSYNRNLTETHEIRSKRTSPIKRKSVNYYPDKRARHLSFKRKIDI